MHQSFVTLRHTYKKIGQKQKRMGLVIQRAKRDSWLNQHRLTAIAFLAWNANFVKHQMTHSQPFLSTLVPLVAALSPLLLCKWINLVAQSLKGGWNCALMTGCIKIYMPVCGCVLCVCVCVCPHFMIKWNKNYVEKVKWRKKTIGYFIVKL